MKKKLLKLIKWSTITLVVVLFIFDFIPRILKPIYLSQDLRPEVQNDLEKTFRTPQEQVNAKKIITELKSEKLLGNAFKHEEEDLLNTSTASTNLSTLLKKYDSQLKEIANIQKNGIAIFAHDSDQDFVIQLQYMMMNILSLYKFPWCSSNKKEVEKIVKEVNQIHLFFKQQIMKEPSVLSNFTSLTVLEKIDRLLAEKYKNDLWKTEIEKYIWTAKLDSNLIWENHRALILQEIFISGKREKPALMSRFNYYYDSLEAHRNDYENNEITERKKWPKLYYLFYRLQSTFYHQPVIQLFYIDACVRFNQLVSDLHKLGDFVSQKSQVNN